MTSFNSTTMKAFLFTSFVAAAAHGFAHLSTTTSRFTLTALQESRTLSDAVFVDIGDGDQKKISLQNNQLTIKPASDDQDWIIEATFDPKSCTAIIDFDVPGKPDPPPVTLLATLCDMEPVGSGKSHSKLTLEFTDPSETIAGSKDTPLNLWMQL